MWKKTAPRGAEKKLLYISLSLCTQFFPAELSLGLNMLQHVFPGRLVFERLRAAFWKGAFENTMQDIRNM